jgi:hypothetical protein
VVHVFAVSLVLGTIAIVDLRLLGFALTKRPFAELSTATPRSTDLLPQESVGLTGTRLGGYESINPRQAHPDNFVFARVKRGSASPAEATEPLAKRAWRHGK